MFSRLLSVLFVKCVNDFMDKKKRSGNVSSGILLQSKFKTNKNNKKEKLFPYYCMLYVSIRVDGKKFAKNILTHNQDSHVKEAA